jgi:putative transposase
MDQRVQFVADYLAQRFSFAELCLRYDVSRTTGYKWAQRYLEEGPEGLGDRSKAPGSHPNQVGQEVVDALLAARLRHRGWGAKKLLWKVGLQHPEWRLPARSTVCDLLDRHGLVVSKPRRRAIGHPGKPRGEILLPNECWSADFKGQFKLGDGSYCYPLTVTDNYSRYLLGCQALPGPLLLPSKKVFTRLFKEYGLPRWIRTDNGTPFAGQTLGRLTRLSAWWVRLGVMPQFIEPGKPQQNGRHERMHRTLKDETTKPAAANARGQQRKFNVFRREFNEDRPHEGLDMHTPSQFYRPSSRPMPSKLPALEYPDRFEVRLVSANGGMRWHKRWVNVSAALMGEYVGFEEIDDGLWEVYYGALKIGRLHERYMRIEDHLGRLARQP